MSHAEDLDKIAKEFGCRKCCVKLKDVKLLKTHYWKVHISKKDIIDIDFHLRQESQNNQNNISKNKRKLKETTNKNSIKKSKILNNNLSNNEIVKNENGSLNKSIESSEGSVNKLFCDKKIRDLDTVAEKEIKFFNLSNDIDEMVLAQKMETFYSKDKENFSKSNFIRFINMNLVQIINQVYFNQVKELLPNRIAWAPWRSFKWPCVINKTTKDARGHFKVYINYYEANNKKSTLFKFDPSKIELFFRPDVDKHFQFKTIGADYKKRNSFFSSYTLALYDLIKQLDEEEKNGLQNSNNDQKDLNDNKENENHFMIDSNSNENNLATNDKYCIYGELFSLDDVKEYAHKPYTEEQLEVNKERKRQSDRLFEKLKSTECKEFLVSIVENQFDCKRHTKYLSADKKVRKEMKFSSPGPLIIEHQQELVDLLNDVTLNHFKDKPENLKDYEYDVLYPEAVIWGLRKLDNLSYLAAEKKYKQGFKRTQEENIKQKCNEIINKIQEEEMKDANNDQNLTNSNKSLENGIEELEDINQCQTSNRENDSTNLNNEFDL